MTYEVSERMGLHGTVPTLSRVRAAQQLTLPAALLSPPGRRHPPIYLLGLSLLLVPPTHHTHLHKRGALEVDLVGQGDGAVRVRRILEVEDVSVVRDTGDQLGLRGRGATAGEEGAWWACRGVVLHETPIAALPQVRCWRQLYPGGFKAGRLP